MAGVRVQSREGEGADGGSRASEGVQCRLADRLAAVSLARRARHLATKGDWYPDEAADAGARRLHDKNERRSQGMARRADYHERSPHRRQLGQLVREHVQMRWLSEPGYDLHKGPRCEIRAIPEIVQPRRTQEAGRGNPEIHLGKLFLRTGVPTCRGRRDWAAD